MTGAEVADVAAAIEAVRDTVVGWFDVDRGGWSAEDRSNVLRALLEVHERVEAVVLEATADWDRHEAWSADGR